MNPKNPTLETLYDVGYFSALDVYFARTVCRLAKETAPLVMLAAALASRDTAQGHVCVDLGLRAGKSVITMTGEMVPDVFWPEKVSWINALDKSPVVARGAPVSPLVLDEGGRLYLARYWQYQQRLVDQLRLRSRRGVPNIDETRLREGLNRLFTSSANADSEKDLQRLAAEKCVRRYLTIVSGGPGTGKTTIVMRMLALIIDQALAANGFPPRISLVAPTGKAAAGLREAILSAKNDAIEKAMVMDSRQLAHIPDDAQTIHRLLLKIRRSSKGRGTLPSDVVVVDESSMVDLALMTRLVAATPMTARLILLGDKDQLASVEAGAVLGDICRNVKRHGSNGTTAETGNGGRVSLDIENCIVHLTHNYRFSSKSGIGNLARTINSGDADTALSWLKRSTVPSVSLIDMADPGRLGEIVTSYVRQYYLPSMNEKDPAGRLRLFGAFRILCVHRRGVVGVETLNRMAEDVLGVQPVSVDRKKQYDGRPIMITQNDYPLGLFNGDIGVVAGSAEDPSAFVVYFEDSQGALRSISSARLPAHETVFAMTTHKSQGAEFEHILLVLPPKRSPVLTRELLYTAVTRARKTVTILGTDAVIRSAIQTPVNRSSGLGELLWAP